MKAGLVLRFSGLFCVAGGGGLAVLFFSAGSCLGDTCYGRLLPGTGRDQAVWAVSTVGFLIAATAGLFYGASRRAPVRKIGLAVALCTAGGALFGTAAGFTAAKTGGETWLMPV